MYQAILTELAMGAMHAPDSKPDRSMARLACTGLAGTSVEWYDFFLYGTAAALVFPTVYGPLAALFAELFTTRVRYSGASLGYQLGSVLGGALAPIIATTLLTSYHSSVGISVYVAVICAVSLVSMALLKETYRVELHEKAAVASLAAINPR